MRECLTLFSKLAQNQKIPACAATARNSPKLRSRLQQEILDILAERGRREEESSVV